MIKIQKLKEPKVTSGWRLEEGETIHISGMEILNTNKFAVYVDTYKRKKGEQKPDKKQK